MSGICFVGYASHAYRILFVLLPVGLCATGGLVFLVRGLLLCWQIVLQLEMCLSKCCQIYVNKVLSKHDSSQIVCNTLVIER